MLKSITLSLSTATLPADSTVKQNLLRIHHVKSMTHDTGSMVTEALDIAQRQGFIGLLLQCRPTTSSNFQAFTQKSKKSDWTFTYTAINQSLTNSKSPLKIPEILGFIHYPIITLQP